MNTHTDKWLNICLHICPVFLCYCTFLWCQTRGEEEERRELFWCCDVEVVGVKAVEAEGGARWRQMIRCGDPLKGTVESRSRRRRSAFVWYDFFVWSKNRTTRADSDISLTTLSPPPHTIFFLLCRSWGNLLPSAGVFCQAWMYFPLCVGRKRKTIKAFTARFETFDFPLGPAECVMTTVPEN